MTLQDKSKLERMIGRSWMYRGATSNFNDLVESNGHIILSTSLKAIKIPADQVSKFIQDCLPAEDASDTQVVKIELDAKVLSEITSGMMKSFRELDTATPEEMKNVIQKAQAKTNVANSVIAIANTIMKAKRMR
jgi:hypothetical protein